MQPTQRLWKSVVCVESKWVVGFNFFVIRPTRLIVYLVFTSSRKFHIVSFQNVWSRISCQVLLCGCAVTTKGVGLDSGTSDCRVLWCLVCYGVSSPWSMIVTKVSYHLVTVLFRVQPVNSPVRILRDTSPRPGSSKFARVFGRPSRGR